MSDGAVVIVGGTSGICLRLAQAYAARGRNVVISGRDNERASDIAASIAGPGHVKACAVDLTSPADIAERLADIGPVARLILGAVERDDNSVASYDIVSATKLVTLKLVGYTKSCTRSCHA